MIGFPKSLQTQRISVKEYRNLPRQGYRIIKRNKYGLSSQIRKAQKLFKSLPKRICRNCGKEYEKPYKFSITQWSTGKYCSRKCAGEAQRIRDGMTKGERHRRKIGRLKMHTPEWLQRIKATTTEAMKRPDVKEKISKPKGPMSEIHKTAISISLKGKMPKFIPRLSGEYSPMFGKHKSLKWKINQSNKLKGKMPLNMMFGSNGAYPHVQRGNYLCSKGDMYFRSKWEANYALYLDFLVKQGEIEKWEYEPDTFIFEKIQFGTRSYTPDFKVFNKDRTFEYHEVKGYMDSKGKTKLKRMEKYYPEVKLILIDSDYYRVLIKQVGKMLHFY